MNNLQPTHMGHWRLEDRWDWYYQYALFILCEHPDNAAIYADAALKEYKARFVDEDPQDTIP